MPRKPRIQATDTPYHITPRGVDKQAIVVDDDDRRTLVRIFGQTVIEYRWSLRAFCLLDNHLHALVVTRDANVSVGMKLFQQTYVRHFNDRHGRVGPLFQGRFGAQVLERDEHHLATLRYIPLNPVTHGACDRPEDWRWSSYRATIGCGRPPRFVDVDAVAAIFDDGVAGYRRFVELGIEDAIGRRRTLTEILSKPGGIRIAHDDYGYSLRRIGRELGRHHRLVAVELERLRGVPEGTSSGSSSGWNQG